MKVSSPFVAPILLAAALLAAAALLSSAVAGQTSEPRTVASLESGTVVDAGAIQARMVQQFDRESADRAAIQQLLQRPEVREIAGAAGIDLARADAAAAVVSGNELADLAAQAAQIDEQVGGQNIVISATAVIIILLILILLTS